MQMSHLGALSVNYLQQKGSAQLLGSRPASKPQVGCQIEAAMGTAAMIIYIVHSALESFMGTRLR